MTTDHDYGAIGSHYADYTSLYDRATLYQQNYEYYHSEAEHHFKSAELLGSEVFAAPDETSRLTDDELHERRYSLRLAGLMCLARALDMQINLHNATYAIDRFTREARNHYKAHADQYYDLALQLATQAGQKIITE